MVSPMACLFNKQITGGLISGVVGNFFKKIIKLNTPTLIISKTCLNNRGVHWDGENTGTFPTPDFDYGTSWPCFSLHNCFKAKPISDYYFFLPD